MRNDDRKETVEDYETLMKEPNNEREDKDNPSAEGIVNNQYENQKSEDEVHMDILDDDINYLKYRKEKLEKRKERFLRTTDPEEKNLLFGLDEFENEIKELEQIIQENEKESEQDDDIEDSVMVEIESVKKELVHLEEIKNDIIEEKNRLKGNISKKEAVSISDKIHYINERMIDLNGYLEFLTEEDELNKKEEQEETEKGQNDGESGGQEEEQVAVPKYTQEDVEIIVENENALQDAMEIVTEQNFDKFNDADLENKKEELEKALAEERAHGKEGGIILFAIGYIEGEINKRLQNVGTNPESESAQEDEPEEEEPEDNEPDKEELEDEKPETEELEDDEPEEEAPKDEEEEKVSKDENGEKAEKPDVIENEESLLYPDFTEMREAIGIRHFIGHKIKSVGRTIVSTVKRFTGFVGGLFKRFKFVDRRNIVDEMDTVDREVLGSDSDVNNNPWLEANVEDKSAEELLRAGAKSSGQMEADKENSGMGYDDWKC